MNKLIIAVAITTILLGCGKKSSSEHITLAEDYVKTNQIDAAIIEYKSAISLETNNTHIRESLAKLYIKKGLLEFAEKELAFVLERDREHEFALSQIVKIYNLLNDYESTLFLEGPLRWTNQEHEAAFHFHQAIAHYRLGDSKLAQTKLSATSTKFSNTIFGQLAHILQMLNDKPKAAMEQISLLQQEHPSNTDILLNKALILSFNGDYQQAADAYTQHLDLMPEYRQIRFYIANSLIQAKQYEAAKTHTAFLMKEAKNNAFANQLHATVLYTELDFTAALPLLEVAIQNGLDSATNRLMAGVSAFQTQKYELSHRYLSSIEDKLPKDHFARKILGVTQLQLGNATDATATLLGLDGLQASDSELLSSASYELIKEGNFSEAEKLIKQNDALVKGNTRGLLRQGMMKLQIEDVSGLIDLEKALEIDPQLPIAKTALANAYLNTGKYDKALTLAAELQADGDILGYNVAGYAYTKQNKTDSAAKAFNQALALDEYNVPSLMYFATQALNNEKYADAIAHLETLFENHPDNFSALKMYYYVHQKSGNTEPALALMEARLDANVTSEAHRLQLAQLYVSEKKPNQVIRILTGDNFKPNDNTNPFYWQALGDSLMLVNRGDEGVAEYKNWLAYKPTSELAWIKLITAQERLKQYEAALESSKAGLSKLPNNKAIQLLTVNLLIKSNQLTEAEQQLSANFADNFDNPSVKLLRGQIHLNRRAFNQALPLLKDYYNKHQTSDVARYIYASYLGLKNRNSAIDFLTTHVDTQPNDIANLVLVANEYLNQDNNKAQFYYKKILKLVPSNLMALNNLAWLQLNNKELVAAKDTISFALKIYNKHPAILDTAAVIYEHSNDIAKAKELVTKAYELNKTNREIKANYDRIMAL